MIGLSNYKYSFLFALILKSLDIQLSPDASQLVNLAFGTFILSLICLLNFFNVVGYLIALYLVNKYDVETKFPKFKRIIRYYENSSLIFVLIEGLMCVVFLFILIYASLAILVINLFSN